MKMDFDEDDLSSFTDLDDNGFPVSSSVDEESRGEEVEGGMSLPVGDVCSSTSDFAIDFYLSGTNWSELVRDEGDEVPKNGEKVKKALVQRDLFQVWGISKSSKRPGISIPSTPKKRQRSVIDDFASGSALVGERKGECNGRNRPRSCPFYKKIPGTSFTVDAFRYGAIDGCSSYFLSHFHYDHYGGLSKRWSHGNIYCTDLTARLLRSCLSVNPQYIFPLEINAEHVIEDIKVTLLEANHCPGAALILFRLKNGKCYLHTGDFRASKSMQLYPSLANHHIDLLYLDTTYCNPKYSFPSKDDVLAFVVRTTLKFLSKQPKSLIVVGAYSIGKEPVYLAISQALGVPIYANASRRKILQSFGWPELSKKLCSCTESSPLHVLPLSCLRYENLKEYLKTCKQQFQTVLAFRPTGWTYSESTASHLDLIKPVIKGDVTIYGVPYSEHSSFTELREFVKFLKPEKIIPTVNAGNAANRARMQSYFKEWLKV
ncbi:DNA cross-link repair protein SNM1 isoform X1 [Dendrobium catenatum]|uniref:DNA cross-link repair protein SNM1 n=1 Tax=Dendrobium catenatum TaxID=906689 RepID=A0A2I0WW98_9ASPA|nr:DNA cross-link repair protein SNM1 isoform X1 [Dendrobium catenatum]PKU79935.1 DNA cross-link repair protein SNM1 [Dendrobium catenatum]